MSSEDWNKVYKLDSTFFGNEPSKQQTILAVTILPALTAVLDVLMDGWMDGCSGIDVDVIWKNVFNS